MVHPILIRITTFFRKQFVHCIHLIWTKSFQNQIISWMKPIIFRKSLLTTFFLYHFTNSYLVSLSNLQPSILNLRQFQNLVSLSNLQYSTWGNFKIICLSPTFNHQNLTWGNFKIMYLSPTFNHLYSTWGNFNNQHKKYFQFNPHYPL